MKKLFIAGLGLATLTATLAFTTIKKAEVSYIVDAKKSKVDFSGSKKTDFHPGYFPVKSGTVNTTDGKITGGKFVIDIAGLKVTDASGAGLEGHLKNKDFFDVEKFGEAEFEITGVNYKDASNATIEGNLTIKGARFKQTFDSKIREVADKVFAEAYFNLDRTLIGIGGVPSVNSDVQIGVHLFASK